MNKTYLNIFGSAIIGGFFTWIVFTSGMNRDIATNQKAIKGLEKRLPDEVALEQINGRLIVVEDYKESSEPTRIKAIEQLSKLNANFDMLIKRLDRIENKLDKKN